MPITLNRSISDNIPVDPSKTVITGNGSQTVFNLTGQIPTINSNPNNLIVSLDGAIQEPNDDYTINNTTLTFTTPPDSGARIVVIARNSPYTYAANVPGDATVTGDKIVAGSVTPAKLSTGAPFWNTSSNVALGHTSPATNLHLNYSNYGAILLGANNSTGFTITKETPANTFNIWTGAIGSGTNRLCMTSSGDIGIGGITSPQSKLDVYGTIGFGLRSGGQNQPGYLSNIWSNTDGYRFFTLGSSYFNGTSWITNPNASFGSNNVCVIEGDTSGVSVFLNSSTGNTQRTDSTATFESFEKVRINMNGTIDVKNNAIVNCASVADAWVMAAPWDVRSNVIAPNNMRIRPIPSTNFVEWEQDIVNAWTDSSVGLVYYINKSNTLEPFAGVNAVSRPNGLAGVRIQLVEIIQNTPKSIMRCRLLDGPVTNIQTLFGTGGGNGFLYSTNGIIDSYNVSNFIKYGTGDYAITFVNNMADRNYAAVGCAGHHYNGGGALILSFDNTNVTAVAPNLQNHQRRTSSLIRFTTRYVVNNGVYDPHNLSVVIFGSSLQDNF